MNDLNEFSASLYQQLKSKFSDLEGLYETNSGLLVAEFHCPNKSAIGGMVVQTTEDNCIWLRIYPSYSAYSVDSSDELMDIMQEVLIDGVLWAIGFSGEKWNETTLIRQKSDIKAEQGVEYHLYSWSGHFDEIVPAP